MKRRLVTILSALSLLLCLGVALLWIRSEFVLDAVGKLDGGRDVEFYSDSGSLGLTIQTFDPPISIRHIRWKYDTQRPTAQQRRWPTYSFEAMTIGEDAKVTIRKLTLPSWMLTLATLLIPAGWLGRRWRNHRRTRVG